MSKDFSLPSTPSKRRDKDRPTSASSSKRPLQPTSGGYEGKPFTSSKGMWCPKRAPTQKVCMSAGKRVEKLGDMPNMDMISNVDVSRLTDDLTKIIFQNDASFANSKRPLTFHSRNEEAGAGQDFLRPKKAQPLIDATQTQQIKQILVNCLQNMERKGDEAENEEPEPKTFCRKSYGKPENSAVAINGSNTKYSGIPNTVQKPKDGLAKTSLLSSYLSGSTPAREEYISKRSNVSNSMISSDSIHHSIFLESGRERRQCLLQYLSNVINDGQVVIYVNSIPGAEALTAFLKKHNFPVNSIHSRLMLAESNWILSEFSMRRFSVLICAEDHYHSCPAHFRWVKTIINYELPIGNPLENWGIRNGIVEFSDNLPVHIYTFIKKLCPLDHELVKLLRLDCQEDHEVFPK